MKIIYLYILFVLIFWDASVAQSSIRIPVEDFDPSTIEMNQERPARWSALTLPRRNSTEYTLIEATDTSRAIKANSRNSASGLVYQIDIDPAEFPIVEWSWMVTHIVENGNYATKDGDDYAARIYITFDYNKSKLSFADRIKYTALKTFTRFPIPLRAINYIWANKAEPGTIAPNAYTNWVYMIAVESGDGNTQKWQTASRNIWEDYKAAFGEEPPKINGIAIMSDTDNTGGLAEAFYGDIYFRKDH